jgi:hypothetical protein
VYCAVRLCGPLHAGILSQEIAQSCTPGQLLARQDYESMQ